MNTERRIRELVEENLAANQGFAGVQFLDQLLLLASETGAIHCTFAGERKLCFQVADQPAWEAEVDRAKAKLRMLCANLSVRCNESGDQHVSLYGGEGVIKMVEARDESGNADREEGHRGVRVAGNGFAPAGLALEQGVKTWFVRFKNTPDAQEFVITPQ